MVIHFRLRAATLLISWTIASSAYTAPIPVADHQAAASQVDTSKQSEQTKPAPHPNPDAYGIYHAGDGVTVPRLIHTIEPEFSEKARKQKIYGNVKVRCLVDTSGHVQNVRVIRSAAEDFTKKKDREAALTLDQKAIEAVQQYRFEPATFQGKPVSVELTVEVNFLVL